MESRNIILIGYMGAGKSTVGALLAQSLDRVFIDLDDYIERREGMSVREIFEQKGESHFRELELQYLEEIARREDEYVLATGGGTPAIDGVWELFRRMGTTFYLKASAGVIMKRMQPKEIEKRPLLKETTYDALSVFVSGQLANRVKYYKKADHTVVTHDKTPYRIAAEILYEYWG